LVTHLLAEARRHGEGTAVHSGASLDLLSRSFRNAAIRDEPVDFDTYARFLTEVVVPQCVNMNSRRCLGHMTGKPPGFMHPLADLIGRLNQNLVKSDGSRALALIERQTLAMLHRLVYAYGDGFYDGHVQRHDGVLGIMTSGATLANLAGLWCARNASLPRTPAFRGVEEEGLDVALRHHRCAQAVVVGSELAHYSVQKAAAILGLGTAGFVGVRVDGQQRIDVDALERTIAECRGRRARIVALVGIAGSTDCGSIDPLDEIGRIAQREELYFHVDAAWGAPLLFSARERPRLEGLAAADSIALDGHKQLGLPIGAGVLLLRDPRMARVVEQRAPYMLHAESGDLGRFSLEGSRPGAALLMHAALHVIGGHGYAALIERHLENAAHFASLIERSADFELLHRPTTNIVLYRLVPAKFHAAVAAGGLTSDDHRCLNELNEALQRRQAAAGRSFVSRTTISVLERYRGIAIVALRAVLRNPLITIDDLRAVLDDQCRIAAELARSDVAVAANGTTGRAHS
jgi:putative pyridoxal-dependent aspartate 1-decarboxylase